MENSDYTTVDKELIAALHKERWVNISVKYDDFWKFMYSFLFPVLKTLREEQIVSKCYYKVEKPAESIVQLYFAISQFNLDSFLKPIFFEALGRYYGKEYLSSLGIDKINEGSLIDKVGYDGLDFDKLKLFGIEEYYVDPMTYIIGTQGAKEIMELSTQSASFILEDLEKSEVNANVENAIEKSMAIHLSVLHTFLINREEIFYFLSWITYSMVDQIRKVDEVVDMLDWKCKAIMAMEESFQDNKESVLSYTKYVLTNLEDKDEFEEDWLNKWIVDCYSCKKKLASLAEDGKLRGRGNNLEDDKTVFHTIDKETYKKWQVVYYILRTTNGQLGISLNYHLELNLFYSMKQAMQILHQLK